MPTDALTDAKVRSLKPREAPYKTFDGGGLYLWCSTTGAKAWRLSYRIKGKAQTMSFGAYPEVTLSEARKRRDEARAVLRDGGDPMAPRKAAAGRTLRQSWDAYWKGRQDITDAYKTNAQRCMEMYIFPKLADRGIATITRADLMVPLGEINALGLYTYVRKARMWLSQVFDYAMEHEDCESNPAKLINPDKAFGKVKVKSFAAVELTEVPELMQRLSMENQSLQSVLACRFLAYTWVRTTEMRMQLWDELVDTNLWLIDGNRMKRSRDHIVPLPRQAQEILDVMRQRCRGSRFVWPGDRGLDRPMSENAVLYLLHRAGFQGRMTGHGWRSIASTWANERGINPDVIEMQLAHVDGNATRAAYNRAKYLDQRRQMLQDWADWLDAQAVAV